MKERKQHSREALLKTGRAFQDRDMPLPTAVADAPTNPGVEAALCLNAATNSPVFSLWL